MLFYQSIWCAVLLVANIADVTSAMINKLHISSQTGNDNRACGSLNSPCASLTWAVRNARSFYNLALHGEENDLPYEFNQDAQEEAFNKCLDIEGIGRPVVSAHRGSIRSGKGANSQRKICPHNWSNLVIQDGAIVIPYGMKLTLKDLTFTNSFLKSSGACDELTLRISGTSWQGLPDTPANVITCQNPQVRIIQSTMVHSEIEVETSGEGHHDMNVELDNTQFLNSKEYVSRLGGFRVTARGVVNGEIAITNSIFQNQRSRSRLDSATNLYMAALILKHSKISSQETDLGGLTVNIENITFEGNERALTVMGGFAYVQIFNSRFDNSLAAHAGSAILSRADAETVLSISECNFTNNVAGGFGDYYHIDESDEIHLAENGIVDIDSSCCHGRIPLVGKGGALRIQRGGLYMDSCLFMNNFASIKGDDIYLDHKTVSLISNTSFIKNPASIPPLANGNLIYSRGTVELAGVEMDVGYLLDSVAVVDHDGGSWSMAVNDFQLECPPNFKIRMENESAMGVNENGIRQSHRLDQLSYTCVRCPSGTYSAERSSLYVQIQNEPFAWYVLKTDGTYPDKEHFASSIHTQIDCKPIPIANEDEDKLK